MLAKIQSLWIGERLSVLERLTICSYLANGHEFHLYVYDHVKNVPEGTILRDANSILRSTEVFTAHQGSYGTFSDWFRWSLQEKGTGDYWVDMDEICLRPFDLDDEVVFGKANAQNPNPAVLRFPAGHNFPRAMTRRCERAKDIVSSLSWGEAGGPRAFKEELARYGLEHLARPIDDFFPIRFWQWRKIFEVTPGLTLGALTNSYGVHFWNEMLRRNAVDKDAVFPEGSLIEELKRKYL
jgi:hypothetical protein